MEARRYPVISVITGMWAEIGVGNGWEGVEVTLDSRGLGNEHWND